MDMFLSFFKRNKDTDTTSKSPNDETRSTESDDGGNNNVQMPKVSKKENAPEHTKACDELGGTIYDLIRTIKDPEKPGTLEDLHVVDEDSVMVESIGTDEYRVVVEFQPTVPHCSLATLIGLCLRVRLERCLIEKIKLDVYIRKGTHATEDDINKQINDKERVAAALENPNLCELVDQCVNDGDE